MANPDAAKLGQPWYFKRHTLRTGAGLLQCVGNFALQFGGYPLVSINRQDPLARSQVQGAILLGAKTGPVWRLGNRNAKSTGNLEGIVRAAMFDNDTLVCPGYGSDASLQIRCFIADDQY